MRTKYIDLDTDLSVMAQGYIDTRELPSCLADTLAGINTATLTITSTNGQSRTYHTIEYRCQRCDEYGHDEAACPFTDDDLFVPETEEEKAAALAEFNKHRYKGPRRR